MTPNPCKIGSPEWLAKIRAQYRTDEEIDSWYQPEEPDDYARRVVSDLVRMIDALAAERDAALSLEELPLSEWPADARDKRHAIEMADAVATARADIEQPPATRTSPYRGIPAVQEYQRYAAKVETPSSSGRRDVESAAHLTTGDDRDRLRIEVERLTRERDAARDEIAAWRTGAVRRHEDSAALAERDRLAAALADLREAAAAAAPCHTTDEEWSHLRAALAATPADLAAARDARVRAEALRAAADLADRGSERGGWQDGAPLSGDVLPHEVADWLRAEAEHIERGGR